MPVCPRCGKTRAHRIAPGYYICKSPDMDGFPCNTRYQVAESVSSESPLCECETIAIGKCAECGRWVCGDHSALKGNKRICDDDRAARLREHDRAVAKAEEGLTGLARRFVTEMARAGNPGAVRLPRRNLPYYQGRIRSRLQRPETGWILGCFMKGGIEPTVGWLALLADAQFWEVGEGYEGNHVYPHQVHERGWIPLPRNVFLRGPVQPDDLSGRIVPELCYGAEMALYIPGEAGALSALKAIPRRLDELCAQHGLPTLQG